jgi:hypothetical protein
MDEQTREAMRNNAITNIHGETPYATVELTPREVRPQDRVFLQQWAEKLGVSIDVLLKRILVAAIEDQLYAEKITDIRHSDSLTRTAEIALKARVASGADGLTTLLIA